MGRNRILEVIHLRLAGHDADALPQLIYEVVGRLPEMTVHVFRHSRVETDLLVHLHRESTEVVDTRSELGSRLASMLREHGLVEHSIWIEHPDGST